jgi:metal-responsive CopG/Arc/MetJ family transcriptional regulator
MATQTRPRTTRTFTISFPPELAEQVDRAAAQESRTTSELFREAFRIYQVERTRLAFAELRALANREGVPDYSEEDIERFIHEIRTERQAAKS